VSRWRRARKVATSRACTRHRPDRHAGQHAEGGAAGKVEKLARAKDPRIVQVMAGLAAEYDVVLVARADGTLAADVRPLVRLSSP
jgi:TldD protein